MRKWWIIAVAIWFGVLAEVSLLLLDQLVNSPRVRFASDPIAIWVALGTAFAGILSWFSMLRSKAAIMKGSTALGFGTALLGLLTNPFCWFLAIATFFAFPMIYGAVMVLGAWPIHAAYR